MINKEEFLKTCNLTEDDLTAARISWEELTEIYEDYMSKTKLFRHLGKDSLLIACLAYQVGPYKLLGYGRMPKSTLIKKLEAGNRDIYADFIRYCHYKGKKIPSIERRRKEEYRLLFIQ